MRANRGSTVAMDLRGKSIRESEVGRKGGCEGAREQVRPPSERTRLRPTSAEKMMHNIFTANCSNALTDVLLPVRAPRPISKAA